MSGKRTPRRAAFAETWPRGTTSADVVVWASKVVSEFLIMFMASERKYDNEHMIENIKLMRGVATRLDQFRRMKVREWSAIAADKPTTEGKTE